MSLPLQVKRGVLANLPTLLSGEFYFATDTAQLFVGPTPTPILVGPSAGGGNKIQAIVDFGALALEETLITTSVSATWVTVGSVLTAQVVEGQDHTDDEIAEEYIVATIGNLQASVGFDVVLSAPNGASGKFLVNVTG